MPRLSKKELRDARIQARSTGHTGSRRAFKGIKYTGEPRPSWTRPQLECSLAVGDLVKATRSLYNYSGDHSLPNIPPGSLGIVTEKKAGHSGLIVIMFGNQLAEVQFKSLRPV